MLRPFDADDSTLSSSSTAPSSLPLSSTVSPTKGTKKQLNLSSLLRWATSVQAMPIEGGGFKGRTNKLVDGCYGWWGGGMFGVLGGLLSEESIARGKSGEVGDLYDRGEFFVRITFTQRCDAMRCERVQGWLFEGCRLMKLILYSRSARIHPSPRASAKRRSARQTRQRTRRVPHLLQSLRPLLRPAFPPPRLPLFTRFPRGEIRRSVWTGAVG